MQLSAQSKEFATYLHFAGEEGKEDKDTAEGVDDKKIIGFHNMEDDLAEVKERTEALRKRKEMKKDKVGHQKCLYHMWTRMLIRYCYNFRCI